MNERFIFHPLALNGLTLIERLPIVDQRGFLERLFCAEAFLPLGLDKPLNQINHTLTRRKGAVRGMHFQYPPHSEVKVITCLHGEVYDVAVDLRAKSPTFLQWHGEILSEQNRKTFFIPEGFAHGFQALADDCEMLYFHTVSYHAASEGGVRPVEPRLGISWPLPIAEMSDRDARHPELGDSFSGIDL